MVDDPHLVEPPRADGDLVQLRVVIHRVGVHPIAAACASRASATPDVRVVHVDSMRVVRRIAVVGQGFVRVLDEVVPGMPFPHHRASFRKGRCNFGDGLRPHRLGIRSASQGSVVGGFQFPGQHQHVSVGHPCKIVVVMLLVVRPVEGPKKVAIPGSTFQFASHTTSRKGPLNAASPDQAAILQEVACPA